ncbi:MAG: hypothetical protein IPN98_12230 [Propionivibrio sp.]|nr:hypothetical protein [Propionivibrio sp.]
MRTNIPEKLIKICDDIQESGSTSLTRLTVLKKWFEQDSKRLRSFSIFIASRASTRKGKTTGEAAELFHEARLLLKSADIIDPKISSEAAETMYRQLKDFQSEYQKQQWGPVRIIKNRNLFLVEEGLRIYLGNADGPSDGYRLAANYCENYDPKYGNGLNGPSLTKLNEIVRFMFNVEGREEFTD